jgi:ubiquinone/menaquinone biosynthesis C-methylase UbiE
MDNLKGKEFQNSLDLTSDQLERHTTDLLKGLWELGSMPGYIIELIARNNIGADKSIIDLGCGKGAVLVKLAQHFDIKAIGVDIVPDFINEANNYANSYAVADKVKFRIEDIIETLKTPALQDIVIYGYDSEVLGDLNNTLRQLACCITTNGYIILEFMFTDQPADGMLTDKEMTNTINQAGYRILDRIDWDREVLKQINKQNTDIIKMNVEDLILQYPDKKAIFHEYLQNQINECVESENRYICTTLLLRQTTVHNNEQYNSCRQS